MKRLDIYRLPGIDPLTAGLLRHAGLPTVADLARVEDVPRLAEVVHVEPERLVRLRDAARDLELEWELFGEPEEEAAPPKAAGAFEGFRRARR